MIIFRSVRIIIRLLIYLTQKKPDDDPHRSKIFAIKLIERLSCVQPNSCQTNDFSIIASDLENTV